jgi:hypothetical protein
MKLGDMKIEALKLMFASEETEFCVETLHQLMLDEEYRVYLSNMPGAINRAFSVIEEKRILPVRSFAPHTADGAKRGLYWVFDLSRISDFGKLERVVREGDDGSYDSHFSYHREGNDLLLPCPLHYERYRILYRPRLARVTLGTNNETEIDHLPDNIAVHIPYFIKGELYRDDEPNEAAEARNWFEAAMDELKRGADTVGHQAVVRSVYSMEVD